MRSFYQGESQINDCPYKRQNRRDRREKEREREKPQNQGNRDCSDVATSPETLYAPVAGTGKKDPPVGPPEGARHSPVTP